MVRVLPALIELGLLIYALIDCIQTPDKAVRNLPRWGWLILIILIPYVGPIAWLFAGRPLRSGAAQRGGPWPTKVRAAPAPAGGVAPVVPAAARPRVPTTTRTSCAASAATTRTRPARPASPTASPTS